jgi:hypothetical protein
MAKNLDSGILKPSLAFADEWAAAAAGVPGDGQALRVLSWRQPWATPPFAFKLGGKPSAELLGTWQVSRATQPGAKGVKTQVVTWRDPQSGLECEMAQQTFAGFPAVEWVLRFRNTGTADTPILEDIRAMDAPWSVCGDTHVRRSRGSSASMADFEFLSTPLAAGETLRMAAGGGRSSNDWLPFFNLQSGRNGVIAAIGWSGQWAAEFARDQTGTVRIRAGQELTRLVLHPGEEIRTPRMLVLFWDGDPQESTTCCGASCWRTTCPGTRPASPSRDRSAPPRGEEWKRRITCSRSRTSASTGCPMTTTGSMPAGTDLRGVSPRTSTRANGPGTSAIGISIRARIPTV